MHAVKSELTTSARFTLAMSVVKLGIWSMMILSIVLPSIAFYAARNQIYDLVNQVLVYDLIKYLSVTSISLGFLVLITDLVWILFSFVMKKEIVRSIPKYWYYLFVLNLAACLVAFYLFSSLEQFIEW